MLADAALGTVTDARSTAPSRHGLLPGLQRTEGFAQRAILIGNRRLFHTADAAARPIAVMV